MAGEPDRDTFYSNGEQDTCDSGASVGSVLPRCS